MELKPGYKQTEVGVIPDEWDVKRLREISPSQSVGLVINPSSYFEANGEVPMLVGSCISENKINAEKASRISSKNSERLSACRLKTGDLVTVRVGFPGTTAVVPTELDGCNCASMMIIRSHKSFDSYWLAQLLNSPIGRAQIENVEYGTAQKQFNISDAIDFIFPVPPPAEQSKIAEAAKSFDEYIESFEQKIDKKRGIKQAAMQELLTGKRRLPGFEGEWEVKKLGDICTKIQDGTHFSPALGGNDYLYITSKNIREGFMDLENVQRISAAEHEKIYRRCDARKGDLLLTKDGANTGNAAIVEIDEEFSLLSSVAMLRFDEQRHKAAYFMYQLLSAGGQSQVQEAMSGNAITRLTLAKIRDLRFNAPEVSEQIAISEMLCAIDQEISVATGKLKKASLLKQGMMQQLLTGKIRLK